MAREKKLAEQKIQDLENQLKRALADYSNFQKRVEEERSKIVENSKSILLSKFLNVLDTLENLIKAIEQEGSDSLKQGIYLALKQFLRVLEEEGVKEIDTSGSFDPQFHEAVEVVDSKEENKIVEVLEKGYKLNNKVLRPAKVKVSKKGANHG